MNKKGAILIASFMVMAVLVILASAVIIRTISESRLAQRYAETTQAFWLAEAGANRALYELKSNYYGYSGSNLWLTSLGPGQYSVDITVLGDNRRVTAYGFIPSSSSARITRILEVIMGLAPGPPPDNFYNNVIYAAGGLSISGASNSFQGNLRHNGNLIGTPNIVPGTGLPYSDPTINPLAHLDYSQLRQISIAQGNYHDATHNPPFPSTFWNAAEPAKPNVVFMENSLVLKGNTTVHGFFVVGGEVSYDATLGGNVSVDGCIYTRGNFTINGGGSALNVDGGVWAGGLTTLNGGVDLHYNELYMQGIESLGVDVVTQVVSWRDTQNPYLLTP